LNTSPAQLYLSAACIIVAYSVHGSAQQEVSQAKAVVEELELREVEIARNIYEFNRDIVNGAVSEVHTSFHWHMKLALATCFFLSGLLSSGSFPLLRSQ
jgi:hypothetical protein